MAERGRSGTKTRARSKANAARAERRRLTRLLAVERELWARGLRLVAAVDEVGRGPLAGPVVAAAVVMPPNVAIPGVNDSKQLTPEAREELAIEIRKRAISIGIGAASSREIDRINILRASHVAIRRALARLCVHPDHVLMDGLPIPDFPYESTALVSADALVHGVACASIIAKVTRDHLMHRLARLYPGYGWEHNAGYSTPEHREAIGRLGFTPHHRMSFARLQLSLDLD